MSAKKAKKQTKQFAFRVDETDDVMAWIEAQQNLGLSLKLLIRMVQSKTGSKDLPTALADGFSFMNEVPHEMPVQYQSVRRETPVVSQDQVDAYHEKQRDVTQSELDANDVVLDQTQPMMSGPKSSDMKSSETTAAKAPQQLVMPGFSSNGQPVGQSERRGFGQSNGSQADSIDESDPDNQIVSGLMADIIKKNQ